MVEAPQITPPAPAAKLRTCPECLVEFAGKRQHSRFCGDRCRKAWANRNLARGGVVVPILQAWAETRHARPGTREAAINRYARREMTAIAREFAIQDRAAPRASPVDYVGTLMDAGARYIDRAS